MPSKNPPNHGAALRDLWKPKGEVHVINNAALRAWLKENAGGIDIATFLHNPNYTHLHPKALEGLKKKTSKKKK